jgi:hypothetical protein
MVEVKLRHDQPQSMSEGIAKRLRNSGGEEADHHAVHGTGPTRTHTNIHNPGSARRHGDVNRGEGDINNKPRGVV